MNSLELIFALLLISSFGALVIHEEKELSMRTISAEKEFMEKSDAQECAALANNYYAEAGGKLEAKLGCTKNGTRFLSGNHAAETLGFDAEIVNGAITIQTEGHYG
ncbi:MAG: hypothetical protein AABW99_04760 [archaeon]